MVEDQLRLPICISTKKRAPILPSLEYLAMPSEKAPSYEKPCKESLGKPVPTGIPRDCLGIPRD